MVQAVYLRKRAIFTRWDIIWFLIVFPIILQPSINHVRECWIDAEPEFPSKSSFAFVFDHVDVPRLEPYTFQVTLPVFVLLLEVLILLLPYWNVRVKTAVHYTKSDEARATHVVFYQSAHRGSPGIVPLIRERGKNPYTIFHHKKRELINGQWKSLQFPTNLTIAKYTQNHGLSNAEVAQKMLYYGPNTYTVPIPGFIELYLDQIRSPLFVFQVFSIFCYLLDEYWTYLLFSLASLLFLEGTTVRTRQSNLLELRGVETPPVTIYARRETKWIKITSDLLLPGDLCLINQPIMCMAHFQQRLFPCTSHEFIYRTAPDAICLIF
jgi:cation-transporting ATPase 13A1